MGSDDQTPKPHERLRELEGLRAYIDAASDVLLVLSLPLGTICDVNQTVCDYLGQSRDTLIGSTARQWIDAGGLQFESVLKRLSNDSKGSATMVVDLIGRGDSRTSVELAFTRGSSRGEQFVVLIGRDITDRYLARQALHESESRLKSIFRAAPTGIGVVADRVLLQVNERICQMTGYAAEELAGQKSRILYFTDEDFEYVGREKYRLIREFGTGTVETQWRCKDGSSIDVLLSSTPIDPDDLSIGVTFTALDITDRKRAERNLAQEKAFSDSVIDALPGIFYLIDQDGHFRRWNNNFEEVSGYSEEELSKMKPWDFFARDEKQYIAEAMKAVFDTGQASPTANFVSKDGRSAPYLFTGVRVMLNDTPFLVGMGVDITDRKQAEAEREELIVELEARNAELERFTYTVSHDLKSPLITIKGYVGMLEEDLQNGNEDGVDDDLRRIAGSADTMATLLKDLLELSRVGRIVNPPAEARIDALAHQAIEALAGLISKCGVRVAIDPDLPVVYVDCQRITEVLQNLIENAVKYMGEQVAPTVRIGAESANGMILVHVQDNGMGIEPAYRDRIFGLFDQLDARNDGTGIGLALAKGIVEIHGGRIWVESQGKGCGSKFCFTVPAPPLPGS